MHMVIITTLSLERFIHLTYFFFNDTATTEIYTFPYTTLFRSLVLGRREGCEQLALPDAPLGGAPQHLVARGRERHAEQLDRKSTRLNSSHSQISYAVFCLKKKEEVLIPASKAEI